MLRNGMPYAASSLILASKRSSRISTCGKRRVSECVGRVLAAARGDLLVRFVRHVVQSLDNINRLPQFRGRADRSFERAT